MVSEIRPGEVVIDDSNAGYHYRPQVAGVQTRGGLIPRDYSSHPQGCYAWAKPADMSLIPRSEWSDRGMGILSGSRAVPDGAVAPRLVMPSSETIVPGRNPVSL